MKAKMLLCLIVVFVALPLYSQECAEKKSPDLYFWLWWNNLEGRWQELVDFAAKQKMNGVVIWGLQGWKGDGAQCREVVRYAHERNVRVIHGFGLNGYEEGKCIVTEHPELAAMIPSALANTQAGKWSREAIFCPSKPKSMELLREMLLRAADTGIDGFNFETADVDYITCHCPECEKRFQSANETEHTNKPLLWPLEHLKFAADVLTRSHPNLWLNCEFAMQNFGPSPYTDCEALVRINNEIDPRITVVWCESWAPPEAIARKLRTGRQNVGFYIRSGAIQGWEAKSVLSPEKLLPIARYLLALKPVCVMYRSWRPLDRWAVNMGAASEILHKPNMSEAEVREVVTKYKAMIAPGGPYSFIRHIAPDNLIAPGGKAKLSASSGDAIRIVDGVADPNDGIWRTERNSPKEAFVAADWPEPVTVGRVRIFHQADGQYRSLDYTIQYWADNTWRDVEGMPIKGNAVQGWVEYKFTPIRTDRMRIFITRAKYGNRMGIGEWEVYAP
ncbi:MAG: discoidin domain-containing protein [Kiritimatiellae bacterium]|nr:discoidin domain-containing protein [Kiritimatiellia bacterium]MDD5523391.1 discoidin domain-containing protein [Kiritimatiellia bacterium]